MGKAVIFSLICILAMLGLKKIMEYIDKYFSVEFKNPIVFMTSLSGKNSDAELVVRSLSAAAERSNLKGRAVVYIVDNDMDYETKQICIKTANQLKNVCVGTLFEAEKILS